MAKEKFYLIADPIGDDCFGRFSETANRAAIADGTADPSDPYSWVEGAFNIRLYREGERTHLCSFTPSAYYVWIQNYFVGVPNDAWMEDGDPDGLEYESGGEWHGYDDFRETFDPRFVVDAFTIDTVKVLGMRAPSNWRGDYAERYDHELWKAAEEVAHEIKRNGFDAPIFHVATYRAWREEVENRQREREAQRAARYATAEA